MCPQVYRQVWDRLHGLHSLKAYYRVNTFRMKQCHPDHEQRPSRKPFFNKLAGRWLHDDVLTAVQQLLPLAKELGLTLPQLAVAWVLHHPYVSSVIIGASGPEQVLENVKASGVKLDQDILTRIDEILGKWIERNPVLTG